MLLSTFTDYMKALSITLAVMTSEQVMNGLGKRSSSITTTELENLLKVSGP